MADKQEDRIGAFLRKGQMLNSALILGARLLQRCVSRWPARTGPRIKARGALRAPSRSSAAARCREARRQRIMQWRARGCRRNTVSPLSGACVKQGHNDVVVVRAIQLAETPLQSFVLKPELLLQPDRGQVGCKYFKLDALNTHLERRFDSRLREPPRY